MVTLQGIGEPPLFLAASVLQAVQDAVGSARRDAGLDPFIILPTPATPDRIRLACADRFTKQVSHLSYLYVHSIYQTGESPISSICDGFSKHVNHLSDLCDCFTRQVNHLSDLCDSWPRQVIHLSDLCDSFTKLVNHLSDLGDSFPKQVNHLSDLGDSFTIHVSAHYTVSWTRQHCLRFPM